MAREDDINITVPVEINVEKGKKQSDVLFDYIGKLYDNLQKQFMSKGFVDAKQLKQIVKIGKDFYKIGFKTHSRGVLFDEQTLSAISADNVKILKLSAEEIKNIYKQLSKTLDEKTREQLHTEAGGNKKLEEILIKRKKLELRNLAEPSNETKAYKNRASRIRGYDDEIKEIKKVDRELHQKEKLQERLNQKLKEYNALIKDGSFTSAKDVSRMQSKLLSEQTVAEARGLDTSGFGAPIADLQKKKDLYAQIGAELRALMGEQLSKRDQLKLELEGTRERLSALKEEFVQLRASGKDVSALSKEISDTAKEAKKLEKAIKPSWFEKLVNTFKRIGFYRLARDFFRLTINAFKEGIQGLAQFDKTANETMTKLTSSITIIKVSLAQMLLSVVQMFTPAVKDIATAFADVANNIAQAVAKMKGLTKYTKINTDYIKEYGEEVNGALSFDKFEALSGGNNQYEGLFNPNAPVENTAEVESWTNTLTTLKSTLETVWSILKSVWKAVYDLFILIQPLIPALTEVVKIIVTTVGNLINLIYKAGALDEVMKTIIATIVILKATEVVKWFGSFVKIVKKANSWLKTLGDTGIFLKNSLLAIGVAIMSFKAFSGFLDTLEGTPKLIASIATAILGVAIAIFTMKQALKGPAGLIGLGLGLGAIVAGVAGAVESIKGVDYFAKGGIPDKGSLFVAGESGAEFVTKMPSGQTGVTNIAQFKEAMIEALYEASNAGVFGGEAGDVALYLDGAEIARSKRFKSELNRTNSNLKLR